MELLYTLAKIRTPFFDTVLGLLTKLGEELILFAIFCFIYWCVNKRLAYIIGLGYFLSGLSVQILKISFRIDRPWVRDPSFKPVDNAMKTATGYSFPSGHTVGATSVYGSLGINAKKLIYIILWFVPALVVGFSRMYLGVHTLLDVGVGFALSVVFCLVAKLLFESLEKKKSFNAVFGAAMVAIAAGTIIYSLSLYSSGVIEFSYVVDSCKAAGAALGFGVGFYIERSFINFDVKCDKWYFQTVKLVVGLAGLLLFKTGLKYVIGTTIVAHTVRYFVIVLWVIALYPLIIKSFFKRKQQ